MKIGLIIVFFAFISSLSQAQYNEVMKSPSTENINEDVQGTITAPTTSQIKSVEAPAKRKSKRKVKKSTKKNKKISTKKHRKLK